ALASVSARAAALGILAKDPAPRGEIRFDAGVRGRPGDEAVSLRRLEAVDADIALTGSGSASRRGPADLSIEFGADLGVLADCVARAEVPALPKGAAGRVAVKAEVRAVSAQAPLAATIAASVEGLSLPDADGGPAWTQKRVAFDGKAAFDRTIEVLTGEGTLASDDGTARVSGRAVLGGGAPKRFEGKAVVDLDLGGLFRSRPDLLPIEGMVLGRAKGTVAAEGPIGEGAAAKAEGAARLVVDSIRTEPLTLAAAELDAGLKGGVVEVRSIKGTVNGGAVTGRATLGVSGDALRHSLEVQAKGVRVDPAMAYLLKRVVPIFAVGEKGGVSGLLDASLTLEGGGASWEEAKSSLRGKGSLRVSEGSVSGSGILADVLELFGGGQALPFAAIETEFAVRDRAVWSERIGVDGKDHAMVLKGSTGFDGKLDYRVGAKALKLGKKKLERLKPLLDEDGNLPFTLGGTLWKPRVKPPDMKKLAGNALEDAARKKLKELLGGDDE
ncbi:MAG TPA: AsmA-like C-terminal region-containing protein, partial [Planctomycetota bacterium]|nr:AsmA-like C-terminal region-containing protein [Planctomycetota bacterium]